MSRSHIWCRKKISNTNITLHNTSIFCHWAPIQLCLKILNNITTKTDYITSLSVHLINLLLHHSSRLIWQVIIVIEVPLEYLFKCWVGNKHMIYCIAMTFFNKNIPNSSWAIFFLSFAKANLTSESINIFNEHGWTGISQKILWE